jgi:TonB family protein
MKKLRKILCILIFIFLPVALTFGQTPKKTIQAGSLKFELTPLDKEIQDAYFARGFEPEFPGGLDSLEKFVLRTITYPKQAVKDSIAGRVLLRFTVDHTGKVRDKKVHLGLRQDIDKECLAMLDKMPKWIPAKLDRRNIDVTLALPLLFKLNL